MKNIQRQTTALQRSISESSVSVLPDNNNYFRFFESFADMPPEWQEICASNNLAMDIRLLDAYQRTLTEYCRCWGVIVYDVEGTAIGCAALCLFQTEMIQSSQPVIQRWRDKIRRFWPGFGRMPVLFCGMELPAGATHICAREGIALDTVLMEVEKAMDQLARKKKCRLMVFKEVGIGSTLYDLLSARGYMRGSIPPLHEMKVSFTSFAQYRDALKSRYRAQVIRSEKKFAAAGFEIVSGEGEAFFTRHFTKDAHQLYAEVFKRAANKLELMPKAFFHEAAAALGKDALLTVFYRYGKVCGFTFSMRSGDCHYNTYSGLDYALNQEGDLYFNLFYADMDRALRAGATSLHLGQTSDEFKSRLGTKTENLAYFLSSTSTVLGTILRLIAPFISPKVEHVETHDVFSDTAIPQRRKKHVKG